MCRRKIFFLFILVLLGLYIWSPFFFVDFNLTEAATDEVFGTIRISVCGDGVVEGPEDCDFYYDDGNRIEVFKEGEETCQDLNFDGGPLACTSNCTFDTSACYYEEEPSPGGGGGGGGGAVYVPPAKETKVILQGKAYPTALITVLQDGKVATTKKADSGANFKIEITDLTAGTYTFGLWAEDKEGRRSITFSFTTTIKKDMTTTIGGIFIPPTIELGKIKVAKGETLNILGQTAPKSEITISVESPEITKKTEAGKGGDWDYPLDTTPLTEGSHTTRAKAKTPEGLLSSYSKVLSFYVGKFGVEEICPKADFNKDGKTNLVDFSIMLYWWEKYNPCVDSNQNGIVDLPDFSILMYWWTG